MGKVCLLVLEMYLTHELVVSSTSRNPRSSFQSVRRRNVNFDPTVSSNFTMCASMTGPISVPSRIAAKGRVY